jgi:hypothetical protein
LDFGGLEVRVSAADALAKYLEAPHLRFDPASDIVSGSSLPERSAAVPGGANGFVPGDCRWANFFPWSVVLPDTDDHSGKPVEDGVMTAADVIGAVGGDRADVFALGDRVQQVWQDRTFAIAAGGELHRTEVGSGGVHSQMDLAPLASALNAVLAHLPFPIAEELEPHAVQQQVQGAICTPMQDLDDQRLLPSAQGGVVWHRPVQVRHLQQTGHHPDRLSER